MPSATQNRLSDASTVCPACGWFIPAEPAGRQCERCQRLDALPRRIGEAPLRETVIAPFTAAERLFVAALLLRDVAGVPPIGASDAAATRWLLTVATPHLVRRQRLGTVPLENESDRRAHDPILQHADEFPPVPADVFAAERLPLGTAPTLLRARIAQLAESWRAQRCPM